VGKPALLLHEAIDAFSVSSCRCHERFALFVLAEGQHRETVPRNGDVANHFAGLFVVIYVMEYAGVLEALGGALVQLTELGPKLGAAALLVASAICSSVTDNIPLAAMLAKILTSLEVPSDSPLWWSVILGANLGGNITPIGSASTLVAVTIMHKYDVPISFVRFVKLALPFAAIQIVAAVVYLMLTK